MTQHVTIPYPHPRPRRQSDAGTWRVTVRVGKFTETRTFASEGEAAVFALELRDKFAEARGVK